MFEEKTAKFIVTLAYHGRNSEFLSGRVFGLGATQSVGTMSMIKQYTDLAQ